MRKILFIMMFISSLSAGEITFGDIFVRWKAVSLVLGSSTDFTPRANTGVNVGFNVRFLNF